MSTYILMAGNKQINVMLPRQKVPWEEKEQNQKIDDD
jgi:hypothetical protein